MKFLISYFLEKSKRRLTAGMQFAPAHPNPYGLRIPAERYMKWRRVNMMNKPKNFDEKEWKKKLEEAHDFALYKKEEIKQELESQIKDIDPVELLSHISLLSQFFPEGKTESNQDLREKPILHFLAGLCLKNGN